MMMTMRMIATWVSLPFPLRFPQHFTPFTSNYYYFLLHYYYYYYFLLHSGSVCVRVSVQCNKQKKQQQKEKQKKEKQKNNCSSSNAY